VAKTETRFGECATHGHVEATRETPGPTFPFLLYAVRRYQAKKQPFRCPSCGEPVTLD
jgi:hypothetical protein